MSGLSRAIAVGVLVASGPVVSVWASSALTSLSKTTPRILNGVQRATSDSGLLSKMLQAMTKDRPEDPAYQALYDHLALQVSIDLLHHPSDPQTGSAISVLRQIQKLPPLHLRRLFRITGLTPFELDSTTKVSILNRLIALVEEMPTDAKGTLRNNADLKRFFRSLEDHRLIAGAELALVVFENKPKTELMRAIEEGLFDNELGHLLEAALLDPRLGHDVEIRPWPDVYEFETQWKRLEGDAMKQAGLVFHALKELQLELSLRSTEKSTLSGSYFLSGRNLYSSILAHYRDSPAERFVDKHRDPSSKKYQHSWGPTIRTSGVRRLITEFGDHIDEMIGEMGWLLRSDAALVH